MPNFLAQIIVKILLLSTLLMTPAVHAQNASGLSACWLKGVSHEVQCGTLMRPLDPAQPKGPQIAIRFAVVGALARNKKPDPVFFFAGGPGQSAMDLAGPTSRIFARLLNRRDLVLIDQRGTGQSAPLQCPSTNEDTSDHLDPQRDFDRIAACRRALEKLPHGDLRFYTTSIAMQDVEAIRQALGADQINLAGVSYGTRAALEYMRQFPGHVRRVVIDGVSPPDMTLPESMAIDNQAALDRVLQACVDDPDCDRQHPRLQKRLRQLLASLPLDVQLANPRTGRQQRITLTRPYLLSMLRMPLYVPTLASALPAAIDEATAGRFEALSALSMAVSGKASGLRIADGMHYAVICSEDSTALGQSPPSAAIDFGDTFSKMYGRICSDWPKGQVPKDFYRMPSAPGPTLILSGGADPATPPRHGNRVAQSLGPQARHIVIPEAGHGVMAIGCMPDVLYRFLDEADPVKALNVDVKCAQGVPRPMRYEPLGVRATGAPS